MLSLLLVVRLQIVLHHVRQLVNLLFLVHLLLPE